MNRLNLTALSAAICFALSTGAMGAMTKPEFKAEKEKISAKYKDEKAACKAMTANAKDVCMEEAKGHEKVAKAELDAQYKPSPRNDNDVRLAKAKAAYNVEKEKCDDRTGNDKDVCKKEAKAHFVAAKGSAKVADAKEKTAAADTGTVQPSSKVADAKREAASDNKDAAYATAKEKCDAMTGDAKANCIKAAKARYGQS
jgi:hypothetical protein